MQKTEVPGLYTDGNGTCVNRDLNAYREQVAKRKMKSELQELRADVNRLTREVSELRSALGDMIGSNKK